MKPTSLLPQLHLFLTIPPPFISPPRGLQRILRDWPGPCDTANQIQLHALIEEVDEVTSLAPGEMGLRPGLLCSTRGPRTNCSRFIEAQGSYGIHAACA